MLHCENNESPFFADNSVIFVVFSMNEKLEIAESAR